MRKGAIMVHILLAIIYMAFISLGLPDALLGAAWPSMYQGLSVPVSYSGIIFMIIAGGTIISSLQSDRLTKLFGSGKVTAFSVLMTAVALFGFYGSHSYIALCIWAIPYGLGAGSVDASLNNYVALHYASRHMSWLHCMWGIGASIGPYIMGAVLTSGQVWNMGYKYIAVLQAGLTVILLLSLPLWNKPRREQRTMQNTKAAPLTLRQVVTIPGAKEIMLTFFCYCAVEQTANLWASSYLVLRHGLSVKDAAGFASLFFGGITAGRFLSGFLTFKLSDTQMIRLGQGCIALGVALLFLSFGQTLVLPLLGLGLIGLGCAPIYPSIIHATPVYFGEDKSQAMIGVQMASAYAGTCLMPPFFGLIVNHISVALMPLYLSILLAVMIIMHEKMLRCRKNVS